MIELQIDKTKMGCANFSELIFFCQSSGFLQHLETVKNLYRLADNKPFTWVSNYRPFESFSGSLDLSPKDEKYTCKGGLIAPKVQPVIVSIRVSYM